MVEITRAFREILYGIHCTELALSALAIVMATGLYTEKLLLATEKCIAELLLWV